MNEKICILGRGSSCEKIKEIPDDYDHVLLINDSENILNNEEIFNIIKNKKISILSNINLKGFSAAMFEKLNVVECLINRLSPNWELWDEYKNEQKRSCPGVFQPKGLPPLEEDEPYLYLWRGPRDKNYENIKIGDTEIDHITDEAEQYLIKIYRDKMICNCSVYASLHAILSLKKTHVYLAGLDFYHDLKVNKSSYISTPKYLSGKDWWDLRVKTEGEHMKILYDEYMAKFFPNVTFEFFTKASFEPKSENVIINTFEEEIVYKNYGENYYSS